MSTDTPYQPNPDEHIGNAAYVRQVLEGIDAYIAENTPPDITDVKGRTWTWRDGIYRHEGKAWPLALIPMASGPERNPVNQPTETPAQTGEDTGSDYNECQYTSMGSYYESPVSCDNEADPGETYCPSHKAEMQRWDAIDPDRKP